MTRRATSALPPCVEVLSQVRRTIENGAKRLGNPYMSGCGQASRWGWFHMTRRALISAVVAAASAVVLFVLVVAPTAASAHDQLLSSSPKSGAQLAALPSSVVLQFEEPPVAGYTKVRVVDAAGHALGTASPTTVGSTVTLALPHGPSTGRFTIVWSALSDDGHPVAGTIGFTVVGKAKAVAVAPPTRQAAATTTRTGGAGYGWLAAVAVGVLVLAGVFASFGRRRAG